MVKFPFPLPSRYVPTGERSQGAQGYVHVCRDTFLDRLVAIKVIKSKTDVEDLRKELKALCEIRSPHVAEVYDLVESKGGTLGLVQEYVPGQDLEDFYRNREIPLQEYLPLLYQISCGLADIHAHGKVHRDIKPPNLRLDAERIAKILDFGFVSDVLLEGETTKARGTRGYLGPEFYAAPPMKFSSRADTYAFGVTAWYIANKGHLHPALMEAPPQSNTAMDSFSELDIAVPPEVVQVLDATLSPNPNKRPEMKVVREILERRLLYGRHRAVFTDGATTTQLFKPGKSLVLKVQDTSLVISYDGLCFKVSAIIGDVFINNTSVSVGSLIPGSCVITFGAPHTGRQRRFLPVDTSHPEVVL